LALCRGAVRVDEEAEVIEVLALISAARSSWQLIY
jgi:hypothetical protein